MGEDRNNKPLSPPPPPLEMEELDYGPSPGLIVLLLGAWVVVLVILFLTA